MVVKLKIVLDTNVLVSGLIIPKSKPAQILRMWRSNQINVLLSQAQFSEMMGVIRRPKIFKNYHGDFSIERIREFITQNAVFVNRNKISLFSRDADDQMLLETAIYKADYLITGDKDLLVLKNEVGRYGFQIVSPAEFLQVYDRIFVN